MDIAIVCEQTVYSLLLMLAGAGLANPEPMLTRLTRGCIATAFTASVRTDQASYRRADTVKGGELSYMALAFSLLMLTGVSQADSEWMLARLVSDTVPEACFASVRTVACMYCIHRLADAVKGGEGQLIVTVRVSKECSIVFLSSRMTRGCFACSRGGTSALENRGEREGFTVLRI